MEHKNIIKELEKLKAIRAPHNFILQNRAKLQSHIEYDQGKIREMKKENSHKIFYSFSKSIFFDHVLKPLGSLVLLLLVIVGSGIGMSYASYDSMPGDVFYPVKITLEKAQVSLKTKEVDKVKLEVEFAGRRLEELNKVKAQEAVEKVKQPENAKIALDNYKKNIETVQQRLEKIKEETFDKEAVEVVNMVEKKSLEYSTTLKTINNIKGSEDQKERSSDEAPELKVENVATPDDKDIKKGEAGKEEEKKEELASKDVETKKLVSVEEKNKVMDIGMKEAMNASEALNTKAVDIIIEKHKAGETGLTKEEIVLKIREKVGNLFTKIKDLTEKLSCLKGKRQEKVKPDNKITPDNKTSTSTSEIASSTLNTVDLDKIGNDLKTASSTLANIVVSLDNNGEIDAVFNKVKEMGLLVKSCEEQIEAALTEEIQENKTKEDEKTNEEQNNEYKNDSNGAGKAEKENLQHKNDNNVNGTSTQQKI